ncbi:cation:proton antiporter [Streptomyces sp. TRM72054]|uniref:cation:proton antiporter n=1 Tax=Streptomyces sp. TRM72054 TaxID=2870562 RepID=UPI001C8C8F92|nr:cation:proton antiporter [Streptomyces sp. TRM72054]MBX9399562.1 cation:proton antiporter [Streptomyces sp. TRM72054]
MATDDALPTNVIVLADVAIILVAGVGMVKLGRWLHQPPVVAEIAVGFILGPSLLGLLPGDLPKLIFPYEARPLLLAIAQVGLVLFMFLAGWEVDLRRLRGRGIALSSTAGLAVLVPFAVGAGAAGLLSSSQAPDGVSTTTFVVYMATAFSITAFPVLARIIRDRGLSKTTVGVQAMACAAVGDAVAWCVLALVVALAGAGGVDEFFTVIPMTLAYAAAMAFAVRPLLARVLRGSFERRADSGEMLVLVTAGVLLSSFTTSWIGAHAIFGAFAFGLVMPRREATGLHNHVAVPLEKVTSLLLPVFFVITGLSVDITQLGWSGVISLLLVIAAAIIGKLAGTVIPARLWGMSWRESGAFGALMNTRGLTEIVILNIGRELGLIGPELFTVMVLMTLVTTAMTGPLLRVLRTDEKLLHPRGRVPTDRGAPCAHNDSSAITSATTDLDRH